jgi:leucyl/phenylalanyl-tRNA---protein transferase
VAPVDPPIEPAPSPWELPDPASAPRGAELLGVGADLEPGTLLAAYRRGLFPMPVDDEVSVGWWSPDPRGVLVLDDLRVTKSLRTSCRRFVTTVDTAFDEVVVACGDPGRPGGWINEEVRAAYSELHRLGWAHSVETRTTAGDLVGGLYGVEVGGLFAGESMFSTERDASKVALVALVARLRAASESDGSRVSDRLLDVQWRTDHLASLGVTEIDRVDYLARLHVALTLHPAF